MTRARRSIADLLGDMPAPANGNDPDAVEIEEHAAIVRRLNRAHAFIAGKGIVREDGRGGFTIEHPRQFQDWYANDVVWTKTASGADKAIPVSQIWMQSPDRRQFETITFDPREATDGAYNVWRGFTYKPSERGSCDLYLDHIHDNVCGGDKALYRWLVGWMAHMVQRPWEKPGTAVVLKGAPGVGKSTMGEHLGALVSRHHVTVSTPRGLLGQFNSHMATALLVQIEEGFWAGDKAAEGDLKHKITGPTIALEKKGVDAIELPSFHRYLITSNERWTVPARHDERRYAIFNVSDARKQDGAYFAAIAKQMKNGGYRALMRYLLDFDLSRVDVRTIPQTDALAAEKITGLRGIHAWWHEALSERTYWTDDTASVRTDHMRRAFEEWMHGRRHHGDLPTADSFGRDLLDLCPRIVRKRVRDNASRPYVYVLPPLRECREQFATWLGSEVNWG